MSKTANKPASGFSRFWLGLSPAKRFLYPAVAFLLLAAIAFGIVWSCLDHSFRYDKEDLSAFINAEGLTTDACRQIGIELDAGVTKENIYEKIATDLKKLSDQYRHRDGTPLAEGDLAGMYVEIYKVYKETKAGASTPETKTDLLLAYNDFKSSPTLFRIGAGKLSSTLESGKGKIEATAGAYSGIFSGAAVDSFGSYAARAKDAGYENGDTLVLTISAKSQDGAVYLDKKTVVLQTVKDAENPLRYQFESEFFSSAGDKADNEAIRSALLSAVAGKKVGEKFENCEVSIKMKSADSEKQTVTFSGTLDSAFSASYKEFEVNNTSVSTFYYMNSEGKETSLDLSADVSIKVRVCTQNAVCLTKETVMAMEGYTVPEGTADDEYADAARNIAFAALRDEYIAKQKENNTYRNKILSALWEEIYKKYGEGDDKIVKSYPEKDIKELRANRLKGVKYSYENGRSITGIQNGQFVYTYNYEAYDSYKTYALVEVYKLDKDTVKKMSSAEINGLFENRVQNEAETTAAHKLITYSLAKNAGITGYTDKEKTAWLNQYQKDIEAAYKNYSNAAEIAKEARQSLSESYIRDAIFLEKVGQKLVPAAEYSHITWKNPLKETK